MATEPDAQILERPEADPGARLAAPAVARRLSQRLWLASRRGRDHPAVRAGGEAAGAAPQGPHARDRPARRSDPGGADRGVAARASVGGWRRPTDPALQRSIVNAMIDEARREVWAPVRTVRLAKAASEAMRAVKLRLGRDGNDDEIAAEMGIALGEYHAAARRDRRHPAACTSTNSTRPPTTASCTRSTTRTRRSTAAA